MKKAYNKYFEVREAVWKMIENRPAEAAPSKYWREEIAGFDYMFDASPLIIEKLRHHSYHLTGLHDYEYRAHHARNSKKIEERLKLLKSQDKSNLLVPESPELGGFGYQIDGAMYNVDILKFYESLIALDRAGLLNHSKKLIVLEIGSGWGGLAYQWKTLFQRTSYILVDLPETILFSATYLKTLFPNSKIFLSDGSPESVAGLRTEDYDFIFIPDYAWRYLGGKAPDLILNQASFQEMTTKQVDDYIGKAKNWGVKNIYSWNRDHSPNNPELTTVNSILGKYYSVKEIEVLPVKKEAAGIRDLLKRLTGKKSARRDREYRHLVGYL